MKDAIVDVAAMGVLLFALGLYVSILRFRTQQVGTTPLNPADPLFKAIRAHGNTAEYAPMLAVLMLYLGEHSPATSILVTIGLVTVCRFLTVIGILMSPTLDRPQALRFVGALGTYVGGVVLSVAVLVGL